MRKLGSTVAGSICGVAVCGVTVIAAALAEDNIPPPASSDRAFAIQLWDTMLRARLVGENAIRSAPFKGGPTHTEVLEYFEQLLRVGYLDGLGVIKKNYTSQNGREVSVANVWRDPKPYLMSITVMFRRRGFDPAHKDWFWVEYEPAGKVTYAGKVEHCITCHQPAPGNDYRFLPVPEQQ